MKSNPSIGICCFVAIAVVAGASIAEAAAKKAAAPTTDNLGESLLEGLLDGELGESLKETPTREPIERARPKSDLLPDQEQLRRMMREQAGLGGGEDVGTGQHPLGSVVEGMRRAEKIIQDPHIKQTATPVQREVVAQLERLIAEMEKQCQGGGQCDKPSGDKKQQSSRSQAKPSAGSKSGSQQQAQSSSPARSSTARMGSAKPHTAETLTPEELMKAAWGHLPDKVRERMLQGAGEEFLPEYREEIEAYFRRLAEREAEQE